MKTKQKLYPLVLYPLILILCGIFTNSCKNEDVIITAPGVLHINTLSVINPYTYQVKKDELNTIALQQKLNVVLYIFDDSDKLVKSQDIYLDSYTEDEVVDLNLNPGNYTIVALSRVVNVNGNKYEPMYWDITSNSVNTSQKTIEVKCLHKYYNTKAAILGVGMTQININNDKYEYSLNLQPAGTLLCYKFINPRALGTAYNYTLVTNKISDLMKIINFGTYEYYDMEAEPGSFYLLNNLDPSTVSSTAITSYGYCFMLPMENVNFHFSATNTDVTFLEAITENMTVDLNVGEEYEIWINLKDNKNYNEITYGIEKKTYNYSPRSRVNTDDEASYSECNDEVMPLTELIRMVYPSEF